MARDEPSGTAGQTLVILVADRQLVGEAVRMALTSRGIHTAGISIPTTPREQRTALRKVAKYRPQVAVLLCEPTEPGSVRRAAEFVRCIPLPWLLLTSSSDPRDWGSVMEAGAQGVLPMTSTVDDVSRAITRLARGQPLMSEAARRKVVDTWREHETRQRQLGEQLARLSTRELAVLERLAGGQTVRDIAVSHAVTEGTVRSQVKSILRKLEVSSQLAAAAVYQAAGSPSVPRPRRPRARKGSDHSTSAAG